MWLAQTYDYTVTTTSVDTASAGAFAGVMLVWMLFWIAIAVISIIAMWKIFAKAGKPGWAAIVPIYNYIILLEIIGRPWWWLLLMFIPFVNFVVLIIMMLDLGKAFGKDAVFSVFLLIIFSLVGFLILGFGKDKYVGAPNKLA
jgi:hypothetical protein